MKKLKGSKRFSRKEQKKDVKKQPAKSMMNGNLSALGYFTRYQFHLRRPISTILLFAVLKPEYCSVMQYFMHFSSLSRDNETPLYLKMNWH